LAPDTFSFPDDTFSFPDTGFRPTVSDIPAIRAALQQQGFLTPNARIVIEESAGGPRVFYNLVTGERINRGKAMTFLESLRAQGSNYGLLTSECRVTETPLFVDLCWGEGLDLTTITSDPGIEIEKGSRRFVLMRIAGEIRYYVGPSDPYGSEAECEVGVFPSLSSALAFAHDYLMRRCHLSEIGAERHPRK
jgi:hypothetical protein